MSEGTTGITSAVTQEQKRAALNSVLHSHTFARADQLKSFLRYVCEMELAGRGHELTEYSIGVEALGRPSSYSPGDDSAVRNRAFALRKKLQELYEHESPDAPVRIELLKGSYCPHFVDACHREISNGHTGSLARATHLMVPTPPVPSSMTDAMPMIHESASGSDWKTPLPAFIAGVFVTTIMAGALYWLVVGKMASKPATHNIPSILAEAWGPLLIPAADVLVCVANPPNFSVHPVTSGLPAAPQSPPSFNDPGGRPVPKELINWYKQKYPTPDEDDLFLTITTNATYWGDSIGAMTAMKTMLSAAVVPQMFPEKVVTVPTLRRRNVLLFGAPEYSPAIAHFLEKCPLTVSYLNSIISQGPNQSPVPRYTTRRDEKNRLVQVYGLITVLPSESTTNHQHRTLIFSGVNSAGAQAAAEFFCSPENLLELRKHLKKEGHDNFPPAYQVAVSAETDDNILLNFKYETHRVINPASSH